MPQFRLEDYETVEARLVRFWKDHPNGAVETEVVTFTSDLKSVIIRACVWFDRNADARAAGVGIAQEAAGGNGPNLTSWVENCDTSAVGRALANCGYSGDKRASREEMAKVNRGQDQQRPQPQGGGQAFRPNTGSQTAYGDQDAPPQARRQ